MNHPAPSPSQLIATHARLDFALCRLARLDSNGASATLTDIMDAANYGWHLDPSDVIRFVDEITAACDTLDKEGN